MINVIGNKDIRTKFIIRETINGNLPYWNAIKGYESHDYLYDKGDFESQRIDVDLNINLDLKTRYKFMVVWFNVKRDECNNIHHEIRDYEVYDDLKSASIRYIEEVYNSL